MSKFVRYAVIRRPVDFVMLFRALIVLAWLAVAAFPGAGLAADPPAYRLGPGDKVRVTIFNEKDLSGDFEVNGQGEIALPLIGQVKVSGKTISEAEAIFVRKYDADYLVNPRINVEVLNYRPFFILGEVKNPASYPFQNGMTVINAVALAGGYTPRANKGDIIRVTERFF